MKTPSPLLLSFQQWAWRRAVRLRAQLHPLDYFFWEATLRCNLSCRHCGSDCTRDAQQPELTAEKVLAVFRDVAAHYDPTRITVAVTGGEPLVRRDLFPIMAKIAGLGFPWGMVTNGMLVDERVVALCAETGMRTVVVSLDGLEEAHNWLRNSPQSYTRAVNALRLFASARQFQFVEAITCVHAGNIDQLEELYQTIRGLGANGWRIFTIFPKGRATVNPEITVTGEVLTRTLEFIRCKREEAPEWPVRYSEEGFLGCPWETTVRDGHYYCGAGLNIAGLLCDGSYSACPSLARKWIQGHVDELPFSQAWETRYTNMRDRRWMRNPSCGNCRQWSNCQGSGLHLWNWEQHRPNVCHYRMLHGE